MRAPPPRTDVRAALAQCLRGPPPARVKRTLSAFVVPGARPPQLPRSFVRAHLSAIAALLSHDDAGVRHLAAHALGCSADRRAVAPLVALLAQQRDAYDHDFAYGAIRALGRVAQAPLAAIARAGRGNTVVEAVQALGLSGPGAVPHLRRLGRAGVRPRHFYVAYFNQHDPRGLPDLWEGLRSRDARTRRAALEAADALLSDGEGARPVLGRAARARFCRVLVPLARRGDLDALSCLGWLRDPRGYALVARATGHEDDFNAVMAIDALARYRTALSRRHLEGLLSSARRELACKAAVELALDRAVDRALAARAREALVDGLVHLAGTFAWGDAATALSRSVPALSAALARARGAPRRARARIVQALVMSMGTGARASRRYRRVSSLCDRETRALLRVAWRGAARE